MKNHRWLVTIVAAIAGACADVPTTAKPDAGADEFLAIARGIGNACGSDEACPLGLTCEIYYGVAGSGGPRLETCELRCTDDGACPSGRSCIVIVDGVGRVCR